MPGAAGQPVDEYFEVLRTMRPSATLEDAIKSAELERARQLSEPTQKSIAKPRRHRKT